MINFSEKIYVKKYKILEKKNEINKILLWPDLPYWIYINPICVKLIENIEGNNLDTIIKKVSSDLNIEIKKESILKFIQTLDEANVIYNHKDDYNDEYTRVKQNVIQYVTFNITNRCNLYCKHCYINASANNNMDISFKNSKLIIDKITPYLIKSCNINVSGGEALLNKDCIKILNYLKEIGKGKLNLVTNATLIDANIAKELSKIHDIRVQVSLDGATKNTHELIRGKNTFEKTINGIRILKEAGINVYLSPIVTSKFFNELEEYFILSQKLNVQGVFLQPILCVGRAKNNNLKRVDDSLVFNKVIELYEKNPNLKNILSGTLEAIYLANIRLLERCYSCGSGKATIAIQPNGDCYPCPNTICTEMKCGNILYDDFNSIWNLSPVLAELRNIDVNRNLDIRCSTCEVKYFCGGGCRGQALQNTGNLYSLSPTCEYEKKQRLCMLWTAAQKPEIFQDEVYRQLKIREMRAGEVKETISELEGTS